MDVKQLAAALADRYRIGREIGAGGMATVYLAHDLKHDRDVAIKVLHPELAESLGRDRFLREIRLAARLNHPHILPLHDSGEAGGFLFFVMPVMMGLTLRDRLTHEGKLPVDVAVQLAQEVADALDYAHRNDVVHRDIKPENILLHEGHAIVADFGIGKAVAAAAAGRLDDARALVASRGHRCSRVIPGILEGTRVGSIPCGPRGSLAPAQRLDRCGPAAYVGSKIPGHRGFR